MPKKRRYCQRCHHGRGGIFIGFGKRLVVRSTPNNRSQRPNVRSWGKSGHAIRMVERLNLAMNGHSDPLQYDSSTVQNTVYDIRSIKASASFRSAVSNPSVNQP